MAAAALAKVLQLKKPSVGRRILASFASFSAWAELKMGDAALHPPIFPHNNTPVRWVRPPQRHLRSFYTQEKDFGRIWVSYFQSDILFFTPGFWVLRNPDSPLLGTAIAELQFSSSLAGDDGTGDWEPQDDLLQHMHQREAWDRFYARRESAGTPLFDWFFGYKEISEFLSSVLQGLPAGRARILDVGCGTSSLGLDLYRHSPSQVHVCCLDFSSPAIECLARLRRDSPPPCHPLSKLDCHLGDATELSCLFAPGSFHLVLDKGTCDSVLRGSPHRARRLVAECLQALSPGGRLLQISDEDPDARVPFLETAGGAGVSVGEIADVNGISYYAYTLSRRAPEPPEVGRPAESPVGSNRQGPLSRT